MSSGCLRSAGARSARNRGRGQFFPLAGGCEAVQVNERNTVNHGVADLDDAAESGQSLVVDLFVGQKFRVIQKIPQEPAELPHRLLRAVETTDNRLPDDGTRFNDGEAEDIERFAGMPAELGTINPNEEDAVRNLG